MNKKMNKKGANALTVLVVFLLSLIVVGGIIFGVYFAGLAKQSGVGGAGAGTNQSLVQQVNAGDVAQIKVYVQDASAQNTQTKVAVPVYCLDSKGSMIIDGTTSSITSQISGSTTREETITCYAFNSTYQTVTPTVTKMSGEIENIVVNVFRVTTTGKLSFYTDTFATGLGKANVTSVGVSTTGTLQKLRYQNNNTNQWMPLGGFYFDKTVGSNISLIDVTGSATLFGADHASTSIVSSSLANKVTSRNDKWDYVFEINDPTVKMVGNSGNQPVILEGSDYLDSGSVKVTGNGNGVVATSVGGELVGTYAFAKGYFRSTVSNAILYGYQTDAPSASVITSDITGDGFYVNGD